MVLCFAVSRGGVTLSWGKLLTEVRQSGAQGRGRIADDPCERRVHLHDQEHGAGNHRRRGEEPIANGRVFGVGPELDMPVFTKGKNLGLVSVRYLWPSGPKEALGGQVFAIAFTLAHLPKPIK